MNRFYGWWIVFAGSIILFIASGIGFYCHSVILDPLRELHGWSKGTVSAAITLFFFTNGVAGLIMGRWVDRYGPKWFLVGGSFLFGAGLFALPKISNLTQLFAVYLILAIGFCATALVPVNTLLTHWFIRRRGFAMSIASNGLSLGGMVMVPLTSFFILRLGFSQAMNILAVIYVAVVVPVTLIFIKQKPADIGQTPDGDPPPEPAQGKKQPQNSQMQTWTRQQAMKTAAFWSIAFAFMFALAGQIAYLVHQVSFLTQYLGAQQAAATVSITTGASIMGRLLIGSFVDRTDKRFVTMVCVLLQGTAVLTLAFSSHVAVLYICTFVFGLTMGPLLMMQSLLIGECYGIPSFATVAGAIGLITMPGAAFGPVVAGLIFDATQSYAVSFIFFSSLSFISAGIVYFARPPAVDTVG
jgi:sugar phosphate permease